MFTRIEKEQHLTLRNAGKEDVDQIFTWANEPELRKASFSESEITLPEHQLWFQNKLTDANCFYYILQEDQTSVGQIRFDINNSEALISYSLDVKFRGQGYGNIILKKGIMQLMKEGISRLELVSGFVKKDNIGSQVVFKTLGFKELETKQVINSFKYELHAN